MNTPPDWWHQPRQIAVVVDNDSWILPWAELFTAKLSENGDQASLLRRYTDIPPGCISFFLGCTGICPPEILERSRLNLVVHESALPQGRGFAPLFWQVIEGAHVVTCSLIQAGPRPDEGVIYAQKTLRLQGHELNRELRDMQGTLTLQLCLEFLQAPSPAVPATQTGTPTFYPRRTPADSRLNPDQTLRAQFNLLRTVDNERFPAFFDLHGHRYILSIRKGPTP